MYDSIFFESVNVSVSRRTWLPFLYPNPAYLLPCVYTKQGALYACYDLQIQKQPFGLQNKEKKPPTKMKLACFESKKSYNNIAGILYNVTEMFDDDILHTSFFKEFFFNAPRGYNQPGNPIFLVPIFDKKTAPFFSEIEKNYLFYFQTKKVNVLKSGSYFFHRTTQKVKPKEWFQISKNKYVFKDQKCWPSFEKKPKHFFEHLETNKGLLFYKRCDTQRPVTAKFLKKFKS